MGLSVLLQEENTEKHLPGQSKKCNRWNYEIKNILYIHYVKESAGKTVDVYISRNQSHSIVQCPWAKTKSFHWSSKAECVNKPLRVKNSCLLQDKNSAVCLQCEKKQETRVKGAFVVLSHRLNTTDHFLSATFTSFPKLLLHQTKEPSDDETREHLHSNHMRLLQSVWCATNMNLAPYFPCG